MMYSAQGRAMAFPRASAVFKDPEGIEAGVRKCRRSLDDAAEKYGLN